MDTIYVVRTENIRTKNVFMVATRSYARADADYGAAIATAKPHEDVSLWECSNPHYTGDVASSPDSRRLY